MRSLLALSLATFLAALPVHAQAPDAGASVPTAADELAITTSKPAARAAFSRGRSLYYNLRTPEARTALQEAVKLDPGCALGWVYLALCTRPVSAGKDAIERALKLRGQVTPGEKLLIEAVAAQVRGDVAEEEAKREELVTLFPRDWRVLVARGNRLFHLGRYADAIRYLERAIEAAPEEAAPYNDLGYSYAYANRLDDAVRALRKYAERLPSEPNPHDSLAEILLKAGKAREAQVEYAKALELDPAFVIANEGLGHARLLVGDFEGAREAYRRLADGAATSYERLAGLDWLAGSYAHEGRLDEALRQLVDAEALATTLKEPVWLALFPVRRAQVLAELGRTRDALAAADKGLKAAEKVTASPGLKLELAARALVARGAAEARAGDLPAARKSLLSLTNRAMPKGAAVADPALAGLVHALAAIVIAASPVEEARTATLEDAGLTDNPWGLALLADAHERAGRTTEANALRQRALKLNVMTPELALVRPRLLAGGSLAPGAHFGPVPVTTSSTAALALFVDARRLGEAYRRNLAVAAMEKAVELDPDFALAQAYISIFSESPDEGTEALDRAGKLAKAGKVSDGEKLFIDAHVVAAAGDFVGKEARLRELAMLYPNDWRPAAFLGEHLFRMERRPEAILMLKEAVQRAPLDPYAYNGLGYALALEGRFDEAITALAKYVELSPGESNPHDSLAEVNLLAGRPQAAEAEYRRSLELSPQFVASYAGLGHARLLAGNTAGAREAYRQMADRASLGLDRVVAQTWSALTFGMEGRFLEAASALARAEIEADNAKDRLGAALLAARRIPLMSEGGRTADAIALANHTLRKTRGKLSNAAQAMVDRLALFGLGWAQLAADKVAEAEVTVKELAESARRSQHPEARTLSAVLGAALALQRNQPVQAVALLEAADRHHPLVQVLLAEGYEQSNQPGKAKPFRDALLRPTANHYDLALALHRQKQIAK